LGYSPNERLQTSGDSVGVSVGLSLTIDAVLTHHRVMPNARINIVVTKPQQAWLEREAERLGVRIGEVIRRILDAVRESK
jgi:hypothetical protein